MNMLNLSIAVTAAAALVLLLKLLFGNKITPRGHMLLWLLPAVAMLAVRNTLIEQNIIPGKGITLDVAMRDCCSRIYQV